MILPILFVACQIVLLTIRETTREFKIVDDYLEYIQRNVMRAVVFDVFF